MAINGEGNRINENLVLYKDFGAFGDGKWQNHLTLVRWFDNEPKLDIRPWNEDMTKYGKGVTISKEDAFDLIGLLENVFDESEGE